MKNKSIKYLATSLTAFFFAVLPSVSQTRPEEQRNQPPAQTQKPIELQNLIIEGKEILDIPAGVKQYPTKTKPMTAVELDSLNSLNKMQSLLLPSKPLPTSIYSRPVHSGWLDASMGLFMTPRIAAGYGMNIEGYNLNAKAGIESTNGHIDHADNNKCYLGITSDYIAPDKYIIFGGSRTRTTLDFASENYNMYAFDNAPHRNTKSMDLSVESAGSPGMDMRFRTGASFSYFKLNADPLRDETKFKGFLSVVQRAEKYEFGGGTDLEFRNYSSSVMNRYSLHGSGVYYGSDFTAHGILGLASQDNSDGVNRFAPVFSCDINYLPSKYFTVSAKLSNTLTENSLPEIVRANRYVSDTLKVDIGNKTELGGYLKYHPTENMSLVLGLSAAYYQRKPMFSGDSAGVINLFYEKTKSLRLSAEAEAILDDDNSVNGSIVFCDEGIDGKDKATYSPSMIFGANYRRNWTADLSSQIGASYVGERYADIKNKRKLDGYLFLNAKVDYRISDKMLINCRLENILNQEIYLYDSYKERNAFFAVGLIVNF